jgi:hypothetical protein
MGIEVEVGGKGRSYFWTSGRYESGLDQNGTSRLMRRVRYQSTLYIKGEE